MQTVGRSSPVFQIAEHNSAFLKINLRSKTRSPWQIHSSSPSANALSKTRILLKVSTFWTRAQLMEQTLLSLIHNQTRQQ
ncbi:unnamed protein product [Oikopleura dioica]|uniref:Uncharacterized protein n=1 Tax=Oikopleura dioica TaxID=34765 RepID=E4Y0M7_OIKDI|nr:unnamed protein product [Oikopleura dioica]